MKKYLKFGIPISIAALVCAALWAYRVLVLYPQIELTYNVTPLYLISYLIIEPLLFVCIGALVALLLSGGSMAAGVGKICFWIGLAWLAVYVVLVIIMYAGVSSVETVLYSILNAHWIFLLSGILIGLRIPTQAA